MLRKILLILAVAYGTCAIGQSVDKSRISADSVLIGDQIAWIFDFTSDEGAPVAISEYSGILAQDTTIRGGVEVVREFELDTLSLKNGKANLRAKVLLTSFDSGSYLLPPPIIIRSKDGRPDTLRLDPKSLYVNTIPIDTASFQPYQIKEQETYPLTFREVLPWILLGLLVLLLIWGVVRFIAMKKKNRNFFGKKIQVDPPHIAALKKLEKIRSEKLWQSGKQKAYYTGITDTVREYIEHRYGFGAMEKTSSEIMEELKDKNIEEKILGDLGEMFSTADLVKFAKHTPLTEENEKAIPIAVNFVNFAYMQQLQQSEAAAGTADNIKEKEGK